MTAAQRTIENEVVEQAQFDPVVDALRPELTGRTIILFEQGMAPDERRNLLQSEISRHEPGMQVSVASVTKQGGTRTLAGAPVHAVVFDRLGIAVLETSKRDGPGMAAMVNAFQDVDGVANARPEFFVHSFKAIPDSREATWGLQATGALNSAYTGRGIKLAVLDTGLFFDHPDFRHRSVTSRGFVSGMSGLVEDGRGHGTHCIGTAVGPRKKSDAAIAYGCAPDAELYVGKVLSDAGTGAETDVFEGIEWALDEGCHIISLSLGRKTQNGTKSDTIYDRLGASALAQGSLIVAAAGNDSSRTSDFIAPVSIPANSREIMAVGALDSDLVVATFSNGGRNAAASGIDIAAPGTRILSSYLYGQPYETLSGTSMAAPHVAGIAALWAESDANLRGQALWDALVSNALPLDGDPRDVGAGLVQAPPLRVA